MKEEWKWVNGFEGIYQISNHGRVKSFKQTDGGYILSNQNVKGDYLRVVLEDKITKKRRSVSVHILVAEHFIGERPKGHHVHHKDGNKQNNTVSNLEYIHPKNHRKETEKIRPQIVTGIVNYNKYEKPKKIQQYSLDGIFLAEYINGEVASRMTGICHRNILQVASKTPYNNKGKIRKQAGGYVWKYAEESEVI